MKKLILFVVMAVVALAGCVGFVTCKDGETQSTSSSEETTIDIMEVYTILFEDGENTIEILSKNTGFPQSIKWLEICVK